MKAIARKLFNKSLLEEKKALFIKEKKYSEKSPRTLKQYSRVITAFIDWLPDGVEITKDHVMDYKYHLKDTGSQTTTINNKLVIINAFLKYVKKEKMCVDLIKVQRKQALKNILEPIDYKRMLHWSKKLGMYDMEMLMRALAETGARIAELKFFTVENVEKSSFINVSNKNKERNLILKGELRRALKKYCKDNGITEGYIFRSKKDSAKPASEATIWRDLQLIAGRAKVNKKKVHAHSFRHLFSLRWIANGGSETTLADVLGHSSMETTRIYTRTTIEEQKKVIESMKY